MYKQLLACLLLLSLTSMVMMMLTMTMTMVMVTKSPMIMRLLLLMLMGRMQISPDAKSLAYLAPSDKDVLNVWLRPAKGGEGRMITNDAHRGIRHFLWAEDSQCILYIQVCCPTSPSLHPARLPGNARPGNQYKSLHQTPLPPVSALCACDLVAACDWTSRHHDYHMTLTVR